MERIRAEAPLIEQLHSKQVITWGVLVACDNTHQMHVVSSSISWSVAGWGDVMLACSQHLPLQRQV